MDWFLWDWIILELLEHGNLYAKAAYANQGILCPHVMLNSVTRYYVMTLRAAQLLVWLARQTTQLLDERKAPWERTAGSTMCACVREVTSARMCHEATVVPNYLAPARI